MKETCSAGGGVSELNRPVRPFDEDHVVGCCCEPSIGNYLLFTSVYDTIVGHPFAAIPHPVREGNILNRDESPVSQDKLALGDTRQLGDLTLLPQFSVDAVLHNRHVEHLAGGGAVDVLPIPERLQLPLLSGEPRGHAGFDGGEVGHQYLVPLLGDDGGAHQL